MTEISVVVPVYNGERDLGHCLGSIARAVAELPAAERSNVELLVCDNHSTDRSLEIAREATLDCAVRVIQPERHEPNRTRNWAHGLAAAEGEWLQMLHADDEMAPGGLIDQLHALRSRTASRATLISGRHRTFEHAGHNSGLRPRWPLPGLLDGGRLAREVLPLHCTLVPFTLMRRSAYEAAGGLDERWQLVQDWELWMRLAQSGDVLMHRGETGRWRLHPTSAGYREQNAREHLALADALRQLVPGISTETESQAREAARARAGLLMQGLTAKGDAAGPRDAAGLHDAGDLPDAAGPRDTESARRVLRANARRVAARLQRLRAAGAIRLAAAR
jgi:glycosyltransferase involved in cell wall biosynthesis